MVNILIIIILVTDIKYAQLLWIEYTSHCMIHTIAVACGAQATSYNSGPHYYVTGYHDVDMGARESFPITLIRALFSSFILWFSFFTSCKLCGEREQLDKYLVGSLWNIL